MSFVFHAPESVDEALALLDRYGEEARILAGGTAFSLMYRLGLLSPGHVVSLGAIDSLHNIEADTENLKLGALATHRRVERSAVVAAHHPMLVDAFRSVGTVRIRNQATVGGSLCHADPAQDPPPALLALDASVRLVSPLRERTVALDEFFSGYYETVLDAGEILTAVEVPLGDSDAAYVSFKPRTEDDYATVSVAASVRLDDGVVSNARVALGGAGPVPMRAHSVEAALVGARWSDDLVNEAAALVSDDVRPLDDARGSSQYKRDMAAVWVKRALEKVAPA